MISLQQLTLRRGVQVLLENTSLKIHDGQKLGVIGRNGAGKTSLFKLLVGELSQDAGEVHIPQNFRKAQMRQETRASERSALEYVIDGDEVFRKLEKQLHRAEQKDDFNEIARLHGELELVDGYTINNRAQQLLSGLGFSTQEYSKPLEEFSGGWRIRLNLGQALMKPSDLLLLDEPTNHLDLEATLWLQQWLQKYPGTLLLISHDRAFLDEVVDHIISFEGPQLYLYRGNYSAYEVQKAERLAQQQAAYEKQQQRKQEIEGFVRRFRAKATKARQAQSRLKELNRMADIAPAHIDSPFTFKFYQPDKLPESLLTCSNLEVGYDSPLIEPFSLNIRADSRLGLLGANGQGKSTLLRVLNKELAPLSGEVHDSDYLRIGYMAQHQVDALDLQASPLKLLQRLDEKRGEQEMRNFLGGFDFRGDRIKESIHHFSGGEKSRLALALVVWQKPNLLLLDEPTNHLDLEMRHALTVALQDFNGALVVVSHDRHLLRNTVDQFLLIRDHQLEYFEGDLDDYQKLLFDKPADQPATAFSKDQQGDKKQQRQEAASRRQQLKPVQDRVRKLEKQVEEKHAQIKKMELRLADQSLYTDDKKSLLNQLLVEQGQLGNELEDLESQWLKAIDELETLDS